MSENKSFSIKSRIKSFSYAFNGLIVFSKTQHNVWIHFLAAVLTIILSFYFKLNTIEWCFIVSAIALVIITEVVNTAIEFLTDLVSPAYNEKAGRVKDLAAAAVLLSSVYAVIIGALIFLPKIIETYEVVRF